MNEISFFKYLVNIGFINTDNLICARTFGWGNDAYIKLEYNNKSIRKIRPFELAKKYLKDIHNIIVKNVNFNNAHYDRIGCSCINVYSLNKALYNKYKENKWIEYKNFGNISGEIEIRIFNTEEMEYSYNYKLGELWHTKK